MHFPLPVGTWPGCSRSSRQQDGGSLSKLEEWLLGNGVVQAAVSSGGLAEGTLLAASAISLEDLLRRSQVDQLLACPVEVIAFSEEEGVRCRLSASPLLAKKPYRSPLPQSIVAQRCIHLNFAQLRDCLMLFDQQILDF